MAWNTYVIALKAAASPNPGVSQWQAIKWMHLLNGSGFAGIQVPLKGSAGTFNNFVSGDYVRTTGIIGDAVNKFIDSNRAGSADGQNNYSLGMYITTASSGNNRCVFGNGTAVSGGSRASTVNSGVNMEIRAKAASVITVAGGAASTGITGISRNNSANFDARMAGVVTNHISASSVNAAAELAFFASDVTGAFPTNARGSIIWMGDAVDLANFQTLTATLMATLV